MSQKVKLEPVQMIVAKPFRLDDDPEILVSPGTYPGKRKLTDAFGGVSWTKSGYTLELSVGQIKAIGARNTIAIEYDVTDHVRRGEIQILH
jgi:hypothetical protein